MATKTRRPEVSLLFLLIGVAACARTADRPLTPITSGTLPVAGLSAPVRVVRDRWGIPHIYATSEADLFVAQGFVQAQDRLFQMDLWRRSSLGRLSEVLGPNFVDRDGMTRRMQYTGDMDAEWNAYGPGTRAIAAAFVRGVNAWVARAHDHPPEEFRLAGWTPGFWSDTDLLSRTDAFRASGDALDEIHRKGISDVVADAVRLVGTPPFFVALAKPVPSVNAEGQATAPVPPPAMTVVRARARASVRDGSLTFSEPPAALEVPARRYIVHLHAPGWNVIGLTSPWLPGIVAGHNEHIAWGSVAIDADTQDVVAEGDSDVRSTTDLLRVKGRPAPQAFQRQATGRGVVLATDRAHHRVFTLRWSGFEPGTAAELAALAIDRAATVNEMRAALARWKLPARRFVFVTAAGDAGFQDAVLLPQRRGLEWSGWTPAANLPHVEAHTVDAEGPEATDDAASDSAIFVHVLGVTANARQRFNVGPLARPSLGPVRATIDVHDWDESQMLVAPGESAYAGSPHYADLASLWLMGEAPLLFSDEAVSRNAVETLLLVPPVR